MGQHDGPVHLEEVLRAVEVCSEADGEEVVRDDLALLRPRGAHHVGGDVGLWAEDDYIINFFHPKVLQK